MNLDVQNIRADHSVPESEASALAMIFLSVPQRRALPFMIAKLMPGCGGSRLNIVANWSATS